MVCYVGKPSTKGMKELRTNYPNTDGLKANIGYLAANGKPATIYASEIYLIDRGYTSYFSSDDLTYAQSLWTAGKISVSELATLTNIYDSLGPETVKYRDDNTQTGHVENLTPQEGSNVPRRNKEGISGL